MAAALPRVLLLPETRRFSGQAFSPAFQAHARRFQTAQAASGETAQLRRWFRCLPATWPLAALCREHAAGDAAGSQWLFADPIHLQMEMRDARVMAWDNLEITADEQQAMQSALAPVFGDAGLEMLPADAGRFFLRSAAGAPLPEFTPAPEMLGSALSEHLPAGRRWAALFNECQVILHNHPLNVRRQRCGRPTVNGVWFWGQGALPESVRHPFRTIESPAWDITALAKRAPDQAPSGREAHDLLDLRHLRSWASVEERFNPGRGMRLDFADGSQWLWQPGFRWRFWRRRTVGFG